MLLDLLFLLAGFGLLWRGGESLVNGSVRIAHRFRITPAVIGLTVVSAGTSMPELVVSFAANWQGNPDLAIGNVLGSNIFNIGLILGISSLIIHLPVERKTLLKPTLQGYLVPVFKNTVLNGFDPAMNKVKKDRLLDPCMSLPGSVDLFRHPELSGIQSGDRFFHRLSHLRLLTPARLPPRQPEPEPRILSISPWS